MVPRAETRASSNSYSVPHWPQTTFMGHSVSSCATLAAKLAWAAALTNLLWRFWVCSGRRARSTTIRIARKTAAFAQRVFPASYVPERAWPRARRRRGSACAKLQPTAQPSKLATRTERAAPGRARFMAVLKATTAALWRVRTAAWCSLRMQRRLTRARLGTRTRVATHPTEGKPSLSDKPKIRPLAGPQLC